MPAMQGTLLLAVDSELPSIVKGPLKREDFVRYGTSSGDRHPMHVDDAAAQQAGMSGVFAQGMLLMGYLAQMLASSVSQKAVKMFKVRFLNVAWPGEILHYRGRIVGMQPTKDGTLFEVELSVNNSAGEKKLAGWATFSSA
jgi:acyl dehydratase